ncbi:MAG: hypothetical protein ACYC6T_02100 [Thermoleophilia bacterium]
MDRGAPVIQGSRHSRTDWIVGALAVGIFGLGCVAAAIGVAVVAYPLLGRTVPHVVGLTLAPWLVGVVWFMFFDLPMFVLLGGAFLGVSRLSRGNFGRFFRSFPAVALGFAIGSIWPVPPAGLAPAPLRIEQTLRWSALGAVLVAVAASTLYSRKRQARG